MYATLGVTGTLTHFVTKIAEGISVGTIVLCGQYNGQKNFKAVGIAAMSSLWITVAIGGCISLALYWGAPWIYAWYGVSPSMAELGIPFLRLRAIGIFFMFLYFSFIGFLRGIKNTRVPMVLFVIGAGFFIFFDWVLIKGRLGFPALALKGSAIAFVIQQAVMCLGALLYLLFNKEVRTYSMDILRSFRRGAAREIFTLSWPVMLDKATLAWAKIWLVPMIAPAGDYALASFSVLKDIEQFAFVPAIAFGQVITLLVSNDVGAGNWQGVKQDIKKVLILSVGTVSIILLLFSLNAHTLIATFDPEGHFVDFAARALPVISALALLDLLQLILSAALRGAGDVKTVMLVRVLACFLFFAPLSSLFSRFTFDSDLVKFILIYGSFYFNDGIMSLIYVKRLSGKKWYHRITASR